MYTQWTDNYVCDDGSQDELWCQLIAVGKQLLETSGDIEETEQEDIWDELPVQWQRKRVSPLSEHFHSCVPHPGQVTPPTSTGAINVPVSNNLVSI